MPVMKDKAPASQTLDISALCKADGRLQGQQPLAAMVRLAASLCADSDGSAAWWVHGSLLLVTGGEPEMWLELQAEADVPLQCQRCLQVMSEALRVRRRFRFVRNEDEAVRLDEQSQDDVLVLPARLDVMEFLEDELILALPIVPRHDECPTPLPMSARIDDEEPPAPNPFAALAALRGRSNGGEGGGTQSG